MNKSLIIINCFIILLVFSYCENGGKSDTITLVDIEPYGNKMQKMPLSQFTGEIRYVALEKKTDKPLLKVILADFTDSYIFYFTKIKKFFERSRLMAILEA